MYSVTRRRRRRSRRRNDFRGPFKAEGKERVCGRVETQRNEGEALGKGGTFYGKKKGKRECFYANFESFTLVWREGKFRKK